MSTTTRIGTVTDGASAPLTVWVGGGYAGIELRDGSAVALDPHGLDQLADLITAARARLIDY